MRKFIYHKSSIFECEVSIVQPRPYECRGDEQLYLLEAPKQFKEERWYSHFFQETLEGVLVKAEEIIRFDARHQMSKKGIPFTEEDIQEKLKSIKVERL